MSYVQLTPQERYVIYHLKLVNLSLREIARRLHRHHSTISRELKRNGPSWPGAVYWHEAAQSRAIERRQRPRHHRRRSNPALLQYVVQRLEAHWSPQTIAGRVGLDYPHDSLMRISPEAIYRWIYLDAKEGGELYTSLAFHHRRRRKQRRYGSLRGLIPGRIPIGQRPAVVGRRRRFGDWEGDTLYGSRARNCLLTHVERKSRYLIAGKLPDRKAMSVAKRHIEQFQSVPNTWRKTLTLDNGKEFAAFKLIEQATKVRVFFADPYCAWQRGTNENTNGLLRRYFPKGTDFSQVNDDHLATIVTALNNRPRKCLGYRTPHEVVEQAISGALAS
jgi:IS30 family transposase